VATVKTPRERLLSEGASQNGDLGRFTTNTVRQ